MDLENSSLSLLGEFVYARVSFYLHCSLDVNKDKMIPSTAVTA